MKHFQRRQQEKKSAKKMTISLGIAIEKLGLSAWRLGLNLQMSDSSDVNWVTNPGITGSNHLPPTHCETINLSFAKPDGMGLMLAINPGRSNWPGFFYAMPRDQIFQISH